MEEGFSNLAILAKKGARCVGKFDAVSFAARIRSACSGCKGIATSRAKEGDRKPEWVSRLACIAQGPFFCVQKATTKSSILN